jgi:hypothetical protein
MQRTDLFSDTMPKLNYDLVIQHVGGDYGNFIHWALDWMDREDCQPIEFVIKDDGSSHYHVAKYLQRFFDINDSMIGFKFYNSGNKTLIENKFILRMHYEFMHINRDLLDSAAQTKTIVIDIDGCILECLQNRSLKMPDAKIKNTHDLKTSFFTLEYVNEQIKSSMHANLYHLNLSNLISNPVNTLVECYKWWKNKEPIRTLSEIEYSIHYWINSQSFFNYDKRFLQGLLKDDIGLNKLNLKNKSSLDNLYKEIRSKLND